MTGEQKVKKVAVGFVVFSLLNILLLLVVAGDARIVQKGIRFSLTCVLAYFLFRGANWARWVVGILAILAAILSVIGFFGMSAVGVSMLSAIGIWMLAGLVFYCWVSYTLLLDKDAAGYFNPPSGF